MKSYGRRYLQSPWLTDGYLGSCRHCGKRSFEGRKAAKLYARREYPAQRMWAYRCRGSGTWHVGHPATEVVTGEVAKHLFYGPNGIGVVRHRQGTRKPRRNAA